MNYARLARAINDALKGDFSVPTADEVLNLTDALLPLFDRMIVIDPKDAAKFGQYASSLPAVTFEYEQGRKISAIKELKAATDCGLKEAKDAIDNREFTSRVRPSVDMEPPF